MTRTVIDIETTSACDLPACGAEVYAEHPTTKILCIAWADADTPTSEPELWRCDSSEPLDEALERIAATGLLIAHNAQFERYCLKRLRPDLFAAPERWADSALLCGAAGRPHALRDACYALCMPGELEKDARGKRLLNMFSIQSSKLYVGTPDKAPGAFTELCEYCRQDVRAERAIWNRLAPRFYDTLLQRQWVMDCRVNDTGIPVDAELIRGAKAAYELLQEEAECSAAELTGGVSLRSTPALREWTAANGYALDSFARGAVDEALADRVACDNAPEVERLLRLRKAAAGTAGKKFAAFIDHLCEDGRIRGSLQARVAHTGRYAGRGVQPQNLPRGFMDSELLPLIRDAARGGVSDARSAVELLHLIADGQECDALAGLCRGAICAPEGKVFVVADYSAVEARVLAWLAGERWVQDIFRGDGKIYERTAAAMYKKPVEAISKHERMAGKIATLALGYGGGVGALQRFASAYGITWNEDEAGEIVRAWRNSRPATLNFWKSVERAFRASLGNGRALCKLGSRACEVKMDAISGRPVIIFRLPSGRALIYWDPQIDTENGEIVVETYGGGNSPMPARAKGAKTSRLYGGILAENITQAVAFDLLLGSLLAISENHADKCRIVMHIHDEIVVECAEAIAPTVAAAVRGVMEKTPVWAPGLRLAAEPEIMRRYKK